jgi:predicted enzyme related to lactoylglutathione lyase
MKHAISWFQIPTTNFNRAVKFYSNILSVELKPTEAMGAKVAVLPHDMNDGAIGGALYHGHGLEPSAKGTTVLLNAGNDLSTVLSKVEKAGGKIVMPKTSIGNERGFMARFMDSEGNVVGLHSSN